MKKLKKIDIINFRGYKQESFSIDEHKNIILLYGNNGHGKTSFFDALEWGIKGELERFNHSSKERNEYFILQNKFNSTEKGFVNILFDDKSNIKRTIKRGKTSDYNSGILSEGSSSLNEFVKTDFKEINIINEKFNFSHLLSQELVSSFIRDTKDTERYKTFTRIFGLEKFEKYHEKAIDIFKKLAIKKGQLEDTENENNAQIENISFKLKNIENFPNDLENELSFVKELLGKLITQEKIILDSNNTTQKNIKEVLEIKGELEKKMKLLIFLKQHYDDFKNNLNVLKQNTKKQLYNKEIICFLKKEIELNYINKNIEIYLEFLEEKNKRCDIEKEMSSIEKEITKLNIQKKILSKDIDIDLLKESFNHYNLLVKLEESKNKLSIEFEEIENKLKEYLGLEKKFLEITINFLEENKLLKTCPICKNGFNLDQTLTSFKNKMDSSENNLTKGLKQKKETLKEQLLKLEKEVNEEKEAIKNKINSQIKNEEAKLEIEKIRLKKYDELIDVYNTVSFKLNMLDISIENFPKEIKKYRDLKVEKNITKDLNYYSMFSVEIDEKISTLEIEIKKYKDINELYPFENVETLEKIIKSNDTKILNFINILENLNKVERLEKELSNFKELERLKKEFYKITLENKEINQKKSELECLMDDHSNFITHIKESLFKESELLNNKYAELIQKFYDYLNPHIYFDKLGIKIDDSNPKNNRLMFEISEKEDKDEKELKLNPSYIFSSAQNNILALSIFLAFSITQNWSNFNFILLDDPIQNMDDVNIHGFTDLIRKIAIDTDKQIIMSTHDERIYKFLNYKFRNNVQTFELSNYGKLQKG